MNNSETIATVNTQDTGRWKIKQTRDNSNSEHIRHRTMKQKTKNRILYNIMEKKPHLTDRKTGSGVQYNGQETTSNR